MTSTQGQPDDDGDGQYTIVTFVNYIILQILAATSAVTLQLSTIVLMNVLEGLIVVPAMTITTVNEEVVRVPLTTVIKTAATGIIVERVLRLMWYGSPRPTNADERRWHGESRWLQDLLTKWGIIKEENKSKKKQQSNKSSTTTEQDSEEFKSEKFSSSNANE